MVYTLGEGGLIWDDGSREKAGLEPIGKADWSWLTTPFKIVWFLTKNIGWILLGILILKIVDILR